MENGRGGKGESDKPRGQSKVKAVRYKDRQSVLDLARTRWSVIREKKKGKRIVLETPLKNIVYMWREPWREGWRDGGKGGGMEGRHTQKWRKYLSLFFFLFFFFFFFPLNVDNNRKVLCEFQKERKERKGKERDTKKKEKKLEKMDG